MEELATAMSKLARSLAGVLVECLGHRKEIFDDICDESTCFLRLNHYPICPFPGEVSGLVPHTDSDFLTILHQDRSGGLQLMKGSQWVAVKPNPEALVVNIGDLLQVRAATLLLRFDYDSRVKFVNWSRWFDEVRFNLIYFCFIFYFQPLKQNLKHQSIYSFLISKVQFCP